MSKYTPCPCSSKQFYHKCCQPYHEGALPENAELLMRSRYSAYALGLADYVMSTTHPDNPSFSENKLRWKAEIMQFSKLTSFPGLKVLEFIDGDERAYVTFTAYMALGAQDSTFTEKSTFLKQDGKWLYLDGDMSTHAE